MAPLNSTSQNASAPGSVIALSPIEIWIQLMVFYGLMAGVVSTIFSIFIWVGIMRNKNLRSRFFIMVGCLTFCRTGIGLQFLCLFLFRSLRTLGVATVSQRRIYCQMFHIWLLPGFTLELSLLCTLVVDRMIAIIKTNYYRLMTDKSAFHVCIAQYALMIVIKLVPSYLGVDMLEYKDCVNIYSFANAAYNTYSQTIDFVMVGVIAVLYFILIIFVHRRVKMMKRNVGEGASDAAKASLQRQLKLMPMLRNLVLAHLGLSMTSKLLLFLAGAVPAEHNQRVTAAGGIMVCIDLFVNTVALPFSNRELKDATFPCTKKTAVTKIEPSTGVTALTVAGKTVKQSKIMYPPNID